MTELDALPGASPDPGTGTVVEPLLDGLLAGDVGTGDIGAALIAHRRHGEAWYGDLVGPLRVPAAAAERLRQALLPRDHALRMTLVVEPDDPDPPALLRAAYGALLDDDRVAVTGVELPLPAGPAAAAAAAAGLAGLEVSVPAWFLVPVEAGWEPALDVLAEDGAENLALRVGAGTAPDGLAAVLRHAVDRELSLAVSGGELPLATGGGFGLLNLIGAVRSALNGASAAELAGVLASPELDPLAAAARRMSEADAAVLRSFLVTVGCPSIRDCVDGLEAAGLIAPDAA